MSVYKQYTNKSRTKYCWGFIVDIPTNEFDTNGNPKRKQRRKTGYPDKKAAQKAERDYLNGLDSETIELNEKSTFDDVLSFYFTYARSTNYAKGTLTNYEGYVKNHLQYFTNKRLDKLTAPMIRNWYLYMGENKKSAYIINGCIKLLKAAFNYAKHEKQITVNPFADLGKLTEQKKLRKRFSTKQLKAILESCAKDMPEFYCIFTLACMTGMRLGEYSALTKKDIDFENSIIYVEKQYTKRELKSRNKTRESTREVHISPKVAEIIKWQIKKYNIFKGFLFKGKDNLPVSENWVNKKFDDLLIMNGYDVKFCRVHDLRGQYVDVMHYLGVPTVYISKEVGHARTGTTNDVYSQILTEVNTNATSKLDAILFN